jgi:hypothetical protein
MFRKQGREGGMIRAIGAVLAFSVAVPASAFNVVSFTGSGFVTYTIGSHPDVVLPLIGSPVTGGGTINFLEPLPDNFSGAISFNTNDVRAGLYSFRFNIGGLPGSSNAIANNFGNLQFYNGVLTSVELISFDDPFDLVLRGTSQSGNWAWDDGWRGVKWGGTFVIEATSSSGPVPEPITWALMVVGFGLVGTRLRRRGNTLAQRALLPSR